MLAIQICQREVVSASFKRKGNVLNKKKKKRKKSYAKVAKIYGKNEFSICEIVKKEREIRASFAVTPQTAKVTATVCDKCLVRMEKEKALNLYNKTF